MILNRTYWLGVLVFILLQSCGVRRENIANKEQLVTVLDADSVVVESPSGAKISIPRYASVERTITIADYFGFMDSLIERGSFVYDQIKMIVLRETDSLVVLDSTAASRTLNAMNNTWIDVNIPEFKLRIYQDSTWFYTFPIRIGQSRERYLVMGDRITAMRTMTAKGKVIRVERNPKFYNPVDGKQFFTAKRDDEKRTFMPLIPWIETEINGIRNGRMIHRLLTQKAWKKHIPMEARKWRSGLAAAFLLVLSFFRYSSTLYRGRFDAWQEGGPRSCKFSKVC